MAPRQALSLLVIALQVMTVVNSSAGVTKRRISKSDDSKVKERAEKDLVEVATKSSIKGGQKGFVIVSPAIPYGLPLGKLLNQLTYITAFDTVRHIPLYSTYAITPQQGINLEKYTRSEAKDSWNVDINELKGALQVYEENLNKGQDNMLQKGHMNPSFINSFNENWMTNTFRLSNAAPQYKTSNFGDWYIYEKWLAKYTKEECAVKFKGIMYIITGTSNNYIGKTPNPEAPAAIEAKKEKKPSSNEAAIFQQMMQKKLGKPVTFPKIAIPRSIWTVACCVSKQGVESMAVMTNNHWLKDQLQQTEMAVQLLAKKLGANVNFFPKLPDCSKEEYTVVLGSMYKKKQ